MESWKTLSENYIFQSKRINLRKDVCQLANGNIIDDYIVAEIPDGVVIIVITDNNEILLVKQYKHGIGESVLELPAGNIDAGEQPIDAAKRELVEETGYEALHIEYIGKLYSKPARLKAITHVFFVSKSRFRGLPKDDIYEKIELVKVPLKQISVTLSANEILTETSLAALMIGWKKLFSSDSL